MEFLLYIVKLFAHNFITYQIVHFNVWYDLLFSLLANSYLRTLTMQEDK